MQVGKVKAWTSSSDKTLSKDVGGVKVHMNHMIVHYSALQH